MYQVRNSVGDLVCNITKEELRRAIGNKPIHKRCEGCTQLFCAELDKLYCIGCKNEKVV